ncbi:MAG TPA: hypothetical protein VNS19_15790 [Acidimicrobiales bacterium]|nr:hypothetical protein [Acidimicrobiales bacterium]
MDEQFDNSQIGPLSVSSITAAPVAWGLGDPYLIVDPETERNVEEDLRRYQRRAMRVLAEQVHRLMVSVAGGGEPVSVLHGVLKWGPVPLERLAGYIGLPVSLVKTDLEMLEYLGVVQESGGSVGPRCQYVFNSEFSDDIFDRFTS